MATTSNKGYELQSTGTNSGTWGSVLNTDVFTIVDTNLGGTVTKTLASSNVTLTASEAQNGIVRLIGALGANVTVTTPCLGFFYVENATTGNFTVTVQYTGGVGGVVRPPQGATMPVVSDATNGMRAGSSSLPPGTIIDYAGTINSRWAGEWLLCDGSAVSRTTYSALFAAIGITWGAGDGTTTFNLPDLRGRGTAGRDDMGGSAAGRLITAGAGVDGLTVGAVGGAQNVALVEAENGPHTHGGGTLTIAGTGTSNLSTIQTNVGTFSASPGSGNTGPQLNSTQIAVTVTGTVNGGASASSGSGTAHNNMQPVGVVNKLIKL